MKERILQPNTRVDYMYRDGANYKLHLHEVVSGRVPAADTEPGWMERDGIKGDPERFYPAEIGFDSSTFTSEGYQPYDDDPDCHELCGVCYTDEEPTVGMTAEELVVAFGLDGVFGKL